MYFRDQIQRRKPPINHNPSISFSISATNPTPPFFNPLPLNHISNAFPIINVERWGLLAVLRLADWCLIVVRQRTSLAVRRLMASTSFVRKLYLFLCGLEHEWLIEFCAKCWQERALFLGGRLSLDMGLINGTHITYSHTQILGSSTAEFIVLINHGWIRLKYNYYKNTFFW